MRICNECKQEIKERPSGTDICQDCGVVDTSEVFECPQCHAMLSEAFYTDAQPECVRCVMKSGAK